MKNEVLLILGGLAIFAIVLSLFIQIQSEQSKEKDTLGKLTVLGEKDKKDEEQLSPTEGKKSAPPLNLDKGMDYKAVITTTKGDITIDLFENKTPKTVNNFVYLARRGFYEGTKFHRVIKDFMIQGGDPYGDGSGGPGYTIEDEAFEGEYTRGILAMARTSAPNSAGSQFFIMHDDSTSLPKDYVIFGEVTDGMDVVDKIATGKVVASVSGEKSKPADPIVVKEVKIVQEGISVGEEEEVTPSPSSSETPTPSQTPTTTP